MYTAIAIHRKKSQYSYQLLLICMLLTIISWIDWSSFVIINVFGLQYVKYIHIKGEVANQGQRKHVALENFIVGF